MIWIDVLFWALLVMVMAGFALFVVGSVYLAGKNDGINMEAWRNHNQKMIEWQRKLKGKK